MKFAPQQLTPRSVKFLQRWQRQVDSETEFSKQVEAASLFQSKNRTVNATFNEVRKKIYSAAPGDCMCVYCECSLCNRIDHCLPKALFPERTFDYFNFVPCCATCNEIKSSRASLMVGHTVVELPLGLRPSAASPSGFLDPWVDDLYQFYTVDIVSTFFVIPRDGLQPFARKRAWNTIKLLKLNERDVLIRKRRDSYQQYLALAASYSVEVSTTRKIRILETIKSNQNQLVLTVMLRNRNMSTELNIMECVAPLFQ